MGTNTYTYDPIGNRLSSTENGTTTTYAANFLNQYTALNPTSPAPTPFTYDDDGNMTSDGTWSYTWDAENRLIEVQPLVTNLGSTLVQYMYDAQSHRLFLALSPRSPLRAHFSSCDGLSRPPPPPYSPSPTIQKRNLG